jgi:hypothetical protein
MQHPIRSFVVSALALVGVAGMLASPAAAKSRRVEWFKYAVSFTCGQNSGDATRVVKGEFATAVNILNAGDTVATFHKSISLTYPPEEQAAGEVSDVIEDALAPGSALQVDCGELRNDFVFATQPPATDDIQGLLVIESDRPLLVEVTTTATGADGNASVDTRRVAETMGVPRPLIRPRQVVICHYPPGNHGNAQTISVDVAALPAHKAHGDTLGPCPQSGN